MYVFFYSIVPERRNGFWLFASPQREVVRPKSSHLRPVSCFAKIFLDPALLVQGRMYDAALRYGAELGNRPGVSHDKRNG